MNLHQTIKIVTKTKPRRGRGYGSGHGGHTTGSGQKGQKTRSSISQVFEGGQLPLTKRIPWLRGKHRFQSLSSETIAINLGQLEKLKDTTITKDTLVKNGLVSAREVAKANIKILGSGKLTRAITLSGIKASASAIAAIEKAGGEVSSS